jgi:hypothetical protein
VRRASFLSLVSEALTIINLLGAAVSAASPLALCQLHQCMRAYKQHKRDEQSMALFEQVAFEARLVKAAV